MNTYLVWCPDLGVSAEDAKPIKDYGPEEAACSWAEQHDDGGEPEIVGTDVEVFVKSDSGFVEKYRVNGEYVRRYYAWRP